MGYSLLLFLSNIIFSIKVVHNDLSLRNIILTELRESGISKYHVFPSYQEKERIIERIKEKHKDRIEWIEMTRDGVRYVINVEERIEDHDKKDNSLQNIVAKKKGIIKKIEARSGEVVKRTNDYVNKGDIIISGNITKKEKIKAQTRADGVVYAETWYISKVNIPLKYKNEKYSGRSKYILKLYFFDKNIPLFCFYKNYEDIDIFNIKHHLFPIGISISKRKEKKITSYIYDIKSAEEEALNKTSLNIEKDLNEDEYIISKKVLKKIRKNSTIYIEVFVRVYENITKKETLIEMTEEDYKKQEEE